MARVLSDWFQAPNCQNWMVEYVQRLVEQGCIDSSALPIVQNAPRVL